jgi:hypothetical protein
VGYTARKKGKCEMKKLYEITEISKKGIEKYTLSMTISELRAYLKGKREMNGYIEGMGGDKSYECLAVLLTC